MNNPIKVLLAEDELSLAQIVQESLETRGFIVDLANDGEQAYSCITSNTYDILVLDVMMPKKDGFTLARELRETNREIPILFLTAKSQTKDVVEGFEIGGNDYLKKPFSMEELIVRIKALLNRVQSALDTVSVGQYSFDRTQQLLIYNDSQEVLTHRENELLYHLIQQKNEVLDRSFILKKLWGSDDFFNARSMDVFISKLRKKLKKDPRVQIVNIRGFGYKLIC